MISQRLVLPLLFCLTCSIASAQNSVESYWGTPAGPMSNEIGCVVKFNDDLAADHWYRCRIEVWRPAPFPGGGPPGAWVTIVTGGWQAVNAIPNSPNPNAWKTVFNEVSVAQSGINPECRVVVERWWVNGGPFWSNEQVWTSGSFFPSFD